MKSSFAVRKWVAGLLLISGCIALYSPVRTFDFVTYDDTLYVTNDPRLQLGFGWENLKWAFTSLESSNWHPLTWLSHLLDYRFFVLDPSGHHLTSVLWHSASTFLLFWLLASSTRSFWPSLLTAGLFAFHPINVESVAWVAERKNVLSTFFWLATIGAYFRYVREPRRTTYWGLLGCFVLGLLSKSMVVTLPVILLVLDYWPLRRLDSGRLSKVQSRKKTKSQEERSLELGSFIFPFKPLVLEKVPLLILSFLVSGITILAQQWSGDLQSLHSLPLLNRLQNATVSAVCYLQKLVWPARLAVIYPHPGAALPWWQVLGSILMLIAVTWGVFRQVRRRPYLAAGWLWFLISSLPIIGIIQVGAQAMADRYAYVPFIGLFIMIAWSLEDLVARFGLHREWFYATMLLPLIPCWSLTRMQLRYWPTSHKLFQHAVEVTSNNYVANRSLGTLLLEEGKVDEAIASIKKSLQANPSQDAIQSYHRGEALLALGGAYLQKGDPQAAEFWLRQGLAMNPQSAEGLNSLGGALSRQGKKEEALGAYAQATRLKPSLDLLPEIHFNWGNTLVALGRVEEAKLKEQSIEFHQR